MTGSSRRVAVVVPSLTGAGAERVARTLAGEFAGTCAVTVVTLAPCVGRRALRRMDRPPWSEQVPEGCRHVHLPSVGSGLSRLAQLVPRVAALARQERFDTVYSFLTWTNVLVAAARPLAGRGFVHVASEHALAQSLHSDGVRFGLLARALPVAYRAPDHLVVVSEAARRSLLEAGVLPRPERVVTIPNPVDGAAVRELARAELPPVGGLPGAPGRLVACAGRLHPQKDHRTLLRAMALLPPSYGLVVVGDGPLRRDLETAAERLGLADRVLFTGALPNPYPVLRRADVVVLPSREEGFGLVAVEAAVLGVPFVGSDVGGLAEVCATLGQRTFPAGNPAALADRIVGTLAASRDGDAGRARAERAFSVARAASSYLALGEVAVTGRGGPA